MCKREARGHRISRVPVSPPRQGRQTFARTLPPLPGREVEPTRYPVAALVPRLPTGYPLAAPTGAKTCLRLTVPRFSPMDAQSTLSLRFVESCYKCKFPLQLRKCAHKITML